MSPGSVLVAGETLVDFLPESPGPLTDVRTFTRRPGGAPANVAVGLTRLGVPPLFWTRLGVDPFGESLATTLAAEGVPDRFVERDPAAKTALAFVSHDETADRQFSFHRDETADTRMQSGTVPDETLATVDWVYAGGVALSAGSSRAAVLDLLDRAAGHDCAVVFDPNARPELWAEHDFAETVRHVLPAVDVLKVSDADLAAAGFPTTPATVADELLDRGPHTVLYTRGSQGVVLRSGAGAPWGGTAASHDGYAVDAVDATGAGDAFSAGVLAALADGTTAPAELLDFASAVAALSTTEAGAMTALPTREAVAGFRDARQDG